MNAKIASLEAGIEQIVKISNDRYDAENPAPAAAPTTEAA